MSGFYRRDTILAPAQVLRQPGEIDRLNAAMSGAGLGQPLRPPPAVRHPADQPPELVELPVIGADPKAVRDAVRRLARDPAGVDLPELAMDFRYAAATVEDAAEPRDPLYKAFGKKIGHGTVAWLPAPAYLMPAAPAWQARDSRPVVALLDTGVVEGHPWLPEPVDGQRFCVDAIAEYGWRPALLLPAPDHDGEAVENTDFGSHLGHGTFLAGLVRLSAPDAQVLSLRVMRRDGTVSGPNLLGALTWLADHVRAGGRVDVACLAFGRHADPDDPDDTDDLRQVRDALATLAGLGVGISASAGNGGTDRATYPAAFATAPESGVASVGAGRSATERAPYSNHGNWVRHWRTGTNVVSILPLHLADPLGEGYGYWTGTSFAAATYAGELAERAATGNSTHAR